MGPVLVVLGVLAVAAAVVSRRESPAGRLRAARRTGDGADRPGAFPPGATSGVLGQGEQQP